MYLNEPYLGRSHLQGSCIGLDLSRGVPVVRRTFEEPCLELDEFHSLYEEDDGYIYCLAGDLER